MTRTVRAVEVSGVNIDPVTRCAHYHGPDDIVALKFKCCGRWFSCHLCHDEIARHPSIVWSQGEFDQAAVLCGGCGHRMTVRDYLGCASTCPSCGRSFNPACAKHADYYFAVS